MNMGPRKKQGAAKTESENLVKEAKVKAMQTSQKSRIIGVVPLLILVATISSAIYIYHFVDLPEIMDKMQIQIDLLRGVKDIDTVTHDQVPHTNIDDQERIKRDAFHEPDKDIPKSSSDEKPDMRSNEQPSKREQQQQTNKKSTQETNSDSLNIKKENIPPKEKVASHESVSNTDANKKKAYPTDSEKDPGEQDKKSSTKVEDNNSEYQHADITNAADDKIRNDLDRADGLIEKKPEDAIRIYDNILKKKPKSPRATYGKAKALNSLADVKRSNEYLEKSIEEYLKTFDLPDVPKALMLRNMEECTGRQQFRGWSHKAAKTIRRVIEIYPDDLSLWNKLGVQYLMGGKNEDARNAFKHVLRHEPDNGYATVHLGFIIKTVDLDNEASISLLSSGIESGAEGVIDGRFFFHLGDAYFRTKRQEEAYETYSKAAELGLFRSVYQRSLYNVDRLTARPWWTVEQTGLEPQLKKLQKNWKVIRDEGLTQMNKKDGTFNVEEENLAETGDWKQFVLYRQGKKIEANCRKVPQTCKLIDEIPDAWGCKRGQVKYSVMSAGVHIWPHCGPTNCRIRAHLGLVVPDGPKIRVGNQTGGWKEGEFVVFDDSFEHEVWHEGTEYRLVLIVDLWHPELTAKEKRELSVI